MAVATIIGFIQHISGKPRCGLFASALISIIVTAGSTAAVLKLDYEKMLQRIDTGQWRGAHYSKDIALHANRLVSDKERMLVTSFHYWKGLGPGHACPVFAYYFNRKAEILLRPHEVTHNQLVKDIIKYRIDWAIISPEPDKLEMVMPPEFVKKNRLIPTVLGKAVIFKTTDVYMAQGNRNSPRQDAGIPGKTL